MSKRGSGSSARAGGGSYLSGKKMVSELNITGSAKQISYAQDILKRPFDWIERNIALENSRIEKSSSKIAKDTYRERISDYKDFGKYLSENQYKPMAKSGKEIKASFIIDAQGRYDGYDLFNLWERTIKKK